jgi:triphosphoribosyl-dephospho-CoA synthase
MAVARKGRLEDAVAAGYLVPTPSWRSRRPVYDFVADIPASPRHPTWSALESIEARLGELADLPILLVWGMRDWCFPPACLEKFLEFWPHAEVHRLEDVGHWVVEDAPQEARTFVERFLEATDAGPAETAASPTGVMKQRRNGEKVPPASPAGPRVAIAAYLACALEATAPKPGNVHPGQAFEGLSYARMLQSGGAIASVLDDAQSVGVGRTVLRAVEAMRAAADTNAHLGTILLLAPLACVRDGQSHRGQIREILAQLDAEDTRYVYEAIRLANPGGLGDAAEADVRVEPPRLPLVEVMKLAADRDLVARQFVSGFETVFNDVATELMLLVDRGWDLLDAIVYAHVNLIARYGDSLIARKCGAAVADEARARAARVLASLDAGSLGSAKKQAGLAELDAWLRGDGNRRNPGTTADLIAAGLFVLLREGRLDMRAAETAIAAPGKDK